MRESWISVKTAVKTIWPVGTEKRKWSLKISCVWEVLFAEIEFELGQTEEVGKNRNIFQVRWIMRVRIVSTTLQYSNGWRVSGKNSGRWAGQDLGAQTDKHGLLFALCTPVSVALTPWRGNRFSDIAQNQLRVEKLGHKDERREGRWQEDNPLPEYPGACLQSLLFAYVSIWSHRGLPVLWSWWKEECQLLLGFTF